jgi:hypothetical protein
MPTLTRRRYTERPDCWHIYYGDVHVGTIAIRVGNPIDTDPWQWNCGFYPGSQPREHTCGTSPTFDQARADFERAWAVLLSNRTEWDFEEWRYARDFHAWKHAMWAAGKKLDTQYPTSMRECPCGTSFDTHRLEDNLVHLPHIDAVQMWWKVAECLGIWSSLNRSRFRDRARNWRRYAMPSNT